MCYIGPMKKVIKMRDRTLFFYRVPQVKILAADGDSSFELWYRLMGERFKKDSSSDFRVRLSGFQ